MKRTFFGKSVGANRGIAFSTGAYLLAFLFCFSHSDTFAQSTDSELPTISSKAKKIPSPARRTPQQIALEETKKAVVNIAGDRVEKLDLNNPNEIGKAYNGMGTGVIIDSRGFIVTNYHVIDGIRNIKVTTDDGEEYVGIPIARDPVTDLAIIKIKSSKLFSTIKLGSSSDLLWGEVAYAVGNPYGYGYTVTNGLVSGLARDVPVNDKLTYSLAIQTNAAINPGNSGGPLVNADGEMIGINAAIRQGAECIAFAIPVDQVVEVVARLIQQETARLMYHGIQVKPSDDFEHVIVELIEQDSPAAKAGLQPNDQLISGNKIEFQRPLDFSRSLLELKSNETLTLAFLRDGEQYEADIVLAGPKRRTSYGNGQQQASASRQNSTTGRQLPSIASAGPKVGSKVVGSKESEMLAWNYLGIKFTAVPMETYKRQFSQYLNTYPDGAIRVSEVKPNSPMYFCGIEVGDIIFGINGLVTSTDEEVRQIIVNLRENKPQSPSIEILLNRPRPYDGESANGHFVTEMELP